MTDPTSNDTHPSHDAGPARGPDAHGQAAMLLVESMMHGMIARSVISLADAIEMVGIAAEVKVEVADQMGDNRATMEESLALLAAIKASLANDLPLDQADPQLPAS